LTVYVATLYRFFDLTHQSLNCFVDFSSILTALSFCSFIATYIFVFPPSYSFNRERSAKMMKMTSFTENDLCRTK
ncbi:MAG: hypothetical protein ACTSW1_03595, partial [Candidatus Hodarchaeales archaeon]